MNDLGPDFVVLLAGVALTLGIGTLLLRAGRPYLEQVFTDAKVAAGVDRLLTVLFLLVTLGFVALVTTADFGIDGVYERVMVKLGLVLLVIGATYGLMMFVVSQIRARRKQEEISDEITAQIARQQAGYDPVSPDLQPMPHQPERQFTERGPHQHDPQGPIPPQPPAPGQVPAPQQYAPQQPPPQQYPMPQQYAPPQQYAMPGEAPADVPEEPPAGGYARPGRPTLRR